MSNLLSFQEYSSEGPPLIILHGLLGSKDNWRGLAKQFAKTYRVFCIDCRNHGDSFHTEQMSYHDMAQDLLTFLDHHNLKHCFLILLLEIVFDIAWIINCPAQHIYNILNIL